jgi:hypothetical protein
VKLDITYKTLESNKSLKTKKENLDTCNPEIFGIYRAIIRALTAITSVMGPQSFLSGADLEMLFNTAPAAKNAKKAQLAIDLP